MKISNHKKKVASLCLAACIGLSITAPMTVTNACSRALYTGDDQVVVTGRTMDWDQDDVLTKIWVSPRGMERDGDAGNNSIQWTSQYGSVYVSTFDSDIVDGINEKGLVVNKLYLAGADVGTTDGKAGLNINGWVQYILDNYKDVNDAVTHLQEEPFRLVPSKNTLAPTTLHVSISDPSGDSAIIEYIQGQLKIHHSKEYKVMTNEPDFDAQLAINDYWQRKGGLNFMPGTPDSADRFSRLSFLLNSLPKNLSKNVKSRIPGGKHDTQAVLSVLSTMRSVSGPLSDVSPNLPNLGPTLWRTVYDQKNLIMYFDAANSLNVFKLNINDFDFSQGGPTLMSDLLVNNPISDSVKDNFKVAAPLKYSGQ
ncbi:linear amide C-N hydrolase [Sporomusa acidovorans]|uniref:Choloylglycine hydrolase/NAAA C-terminal domain-containing protein n=1 Tax=Sporomusa acidovorans (strain ATCC 49682 / DSM 3132 / Mol) TaxID=1123286 RepID=A0ABZ3J9Y2_SPOA4|nr:linear amide C-N hydrolase [Sporomusa acidovorans]OZC21698.1 choloylglycine hydrolase [Sporomusa acidovorans DSM 3132]SDD59795.1 penicillin amidase Cysteine peptidase. MEROPS family C59 [Sporomusa acidovorans]